MSADAYFDNVKLLLHFNGADTTTTFTDTSKSVHTITAFGNAQVDTAQSKFGGASGLFDGTGDYLEVPASTDFNFGTADFTVEFWIRPNGSATGFNRILAPKTTANGSGGFQIWYPNVTTNGATIDAIELAAPFGTSVVVSTLISVNDGNWHHVAFARQSGTTRCFLDGTLKSSATDNNNYTRAGTEGFKIGARSDLTSTTYYNGWLDDLRITKGVARYTSSFSVPTDAFPDEYIVNGQVSSLTLTGNAGTSSHVDTANITLGQTGVLSLTGNYGYYTTNVSVVGASGILSLSGNSGIFEPYQIVQCSIDSQSNLASGFIEHISQLDHQSYLNAYVKQDGVALSGHYALKAHVAGYSSISGQSDLLSYNGGFSSLNCNSNLLTYQSFQGAINGDMALSAYRDDNGLLHGQCDLLAFQDGKAAIDGEQALSVYKAQSSSLVGRQSLYAFNARQSALSGRYGLNTYQLSQSGLDAQYSLYRYVTVTAFVDGQKALNAYTTFVLALDGRQDLSAYTQVINYLQAQYGLLANEAFHGWLMNMGTKAVSRYEGFNFNSLDGEFGSMDDGIYQLTGTTNNGAAINAFIQTGRMDFGDSHLKRVHVAYMAAKANGNLTLSMTAQGATTNYTIAPTSELNTVKSKLALGPQDRYWQAKVANASGADFELENIELIEQTTRRRQ
jgi:hypothetical protein